MLKKEARKIIKAYWIWVQLFMKNELLVKYIFFFRKIKLILLLSS